MGVCTEGRFYNITIFWGAQDGRFHRGLMSISSVVLVDIGQILFLMHILHANLKSMSCELGLGRVRSAFPYWLG